MTRQGLPLLIYYPIWIVRYLSGRKLYRLTLDAVTGSIVYVDRPRKRVRLNLVLSLGGVMLLAFLATTPLKALAALRSPGEITEVLALLILPLFGAGVLLMLWLENLLWERFADRLVEKALGRLWGRLF